MVWQRVSDENSKVGSLIIVSHSQPRRAKKVFVRDPNNSFAFLMGNLVVLD